MEVSLTVGAELYIDPGQRQRAVESHFSGQSALFDAFLIGCIDQLPETLKTGDMACATVDASELRRVAHNLLAVLQLIVAELGSSAARALELSCTSGAPDQALVTQWRYLRTQVSEIYKSSSVTLSKPSN